MLVASGVSSHFVGSPEVSVIGSVLSDNADVVSGVINKKAARKGRTKSPDIITLFDSFLFFICLFTILPLCLRISIGTNIKKVHQEVNKF